MNIMMMSNVYFPFVGGVSRSVETLTIELRNLGHRVLVVTPDFEQTPAIEHDIIRVPAIHHFNGSDFSIQIPLPGVLHAAMKDFKPDIIHSHHPFMLGYTAIRVSAEYETPVVFTHHTFYEMYTHYVRKNSSLLKVFIKTLATEYANLCNLVLAPSKSVAETLRQRGVLSPVRILPTGIDIGAFRSGHGDTFRNKYSIPKNSTVFGFVSRIAQEKNIQFLSNAVKNVMIDNQQVFFLVVGDGPSLPSLKKFFISNGLSNRLILTGVLHDQELIDAYHAMDLFVFASKTETQGLVLVEAMASGVPVIAVHGPAIDDILVDYVNGRLVAENNMNFKNACAWFLNLDIYKKGHLKKAAIESAKIFSKENYGICVLNEYKKLLDNKTVTKSKTPWQKLKHTSAVEFELLKIFTIATGVAIRFEHF
jgi:glycosyltransferase involved in cell wall biosynthesis